MNATYRKITYRLYPTRQQALLLDENLKLHRRLYNAALEQRICAYRKGKHLTFFDQCKELTELRRNCKEFRRASASSQQVTLKRLDRAYQDFFRRLKQGEKPGFPRFKSRGRFNGWGYKKNGQAYKLLCGERMVHGRLRLTGIGTVRMRGAARTTGEPKTCDIIHRRGKWYASVCIACVPERTKGRAIVGVHYDYETCATVVTESGEALSFKRPESLRASLSDLKRKERTLQRRQSGSANWRKTEQRVLALRRKVSNVRRDFLHKVSASIVSQSELIAIEDIQVTSILADEGAEERSINQGIYIAAPGMFYLMLKCKAEEAGIEYHEIPTELLNPTHRCGICGEEQKTELREQLLRCASCGNMSERNINAARVALSFARKYRKKGGNRPCVERTPVSQ